MAQLTDPFIGSNWGWDEGENGWGVGLNETLIQHSFLHNRRIDGIVGSLPGSPTNGQAYFLNSDNRVYFRANDSWYSSDVPRGMDFTLKSTEDRYEFNGSSLVLAPNVSSADDVSYDNSVSGLVADNAQDAIDEVVAELEDKVDIVPGKQLSTEDYTTEEKDKLAAIEDGATANSSDAFLLDRANHTGTQAQSTIVDLVSDLAAKQTISNLVQDLSVPSMSTYLSTQGLSDAFADIVAGESYQGEWDASTNTPTLTSGVGTQGHYYQVSVAGTTTLDGISSWALGDEVLFNGTTWIKRQNYQSVLSVNGQTGNVTLNASDVGAVSSVSMTVPTGLEVSGSPVTSTGTFTVTLQAGYSIPNATSQNNWNTAYNERNRWDGGATGLVAATGRTSLGLGTAAQANVTTSATDTTAGRVLQVGDFGVGGAVIATGGNANNYTTPGEFLTPSTGLSGWPSSFSGAQRAIVKVTGQTSGGLRQDASERGSNRFYSRISGADGILSGIPWVEHWTTANLVKTTSATDTTAGSVLQVGDAGLLSAAPPVVNWTSSVGGTLFAQGNEGGPSGSTNVRGLRVVAAGSDVHAFASRLRRYYGLTSGPNNGNNTTWDEFYTTGNTSADVQTMLSSADNAAIRSNISAAKKTTVVTVSTSTHNVDTANESAYHRFTFNGSKSVTVRPNSTHVLPTDGAWVFRNSNTGNLTIVAGSGVTINPPYGGTLVLEPNMVVTLQKVGTDVYDLIGQTVPA